MRFAPIARAAALLTPLFAGCTTMPPTAPRDAVAERALREARAQLEADDCVAAFGVLLFRDGTTDLIGMDIRYVTEPQEQQHQGAWPRGPLFDDLEREIRRRADGAALAVVARLRPDRDAVLWIAYEGEVDGAAVGRVRVTRSADGWELGAPEWRPRARELFAAR